jgi:hypothetical protein
MRTTTLTDYQVAQCAYEFVRDVLRVGVEEERVAQAARGLASRRYTSQQSLFLDQLPPWGQLSAAGKERVVAEIRRLNRSPNNDWQPEQDAPYEQDPLDVHTTAFSYYAYVRRVGEAAPLSLAPLLGAEVPEAWDDLPPWARVMYSHFLNAVRRMSTLPKAVWPAG